MSLVIMIQCWDPLFHVIISKAKFSTMFFSSRDPDKAELKLESGKLYSQKGTSRELLNEKFYSFQMELFAWGPRPSHHGNSPMSV